MAVYTSFDSVAKQMIRSKSVFWNCYDSDKVLISSYKEKDKTVEDSINELKDLIESQEGDYVLIVTRSKLANTADDGETYKKGGDNIRGAERCEFRVKLKPTTVRNGYSSNSSLDAGLSGLYGMIADLKADNIRIEKDAEIKRLQQIIEENKGASGSYTDKMIDYIAKEFVRTITDKNPGVPGINGSAESGAVSEKLKTGPANGEPEDKSKVISEGLRKVASVMKDETFQLVKKLGEMAESNPEGFKIQANVILDE